MRFPIPDSVLDQAPQMLSTPPPSIDPSTGEVIATTPPDVPPFISTDVWEARQSLATIRQAADNRLIPPDALLGAVLARLSAQDHRICIPPISGNEVGLSSFAAIVGRSGTGKSQAISLARKIVPSVDSVAEANTGTGEGLRESFFGTVEVDGKEEKRQVRHGLILSIGEGSKLTQLSGRKGTTHTDFFLSAWVGEQTGDRNASATTTRELLPGSYAVGIALGLQPDAADWLLDGDGLGLPQRFLWFSSYLRADRDADAAWPDDAAWQTPGALPLDPTWQQRLHARWRGVDDGVILLDVAEPIVAEARQLREMVGMGLRVLDTSDGQSTLLRLKTAALLARLEHRLNVTIEDWQLAAAIYETSKGVRQWVRDQRADKATAEAQSRAQRSASHQAYLDESEADRQLRSAATAIANRAQRKGTITKRDASRAMNGKHREHTTVDEALALAFSEGLIVSDGDGYRAAKRSAA
jgi:energy-coupling factor transporter ATP-binding protein EcfA2